MSLTTDNMNANSVEVTLTKKQFEISLFAPFMPENLTLSVDGLLDLNQISAEQEEKSIKNIAEMVKTIIVGQTQFTLNDFLASVDNARSANVRADAIYSTVLEKVPALLNVLIVDMPFTQMLMDLLSHYAAKQQMFLIELVNLEIQNGITYGYSITPEDALNAEELQKYLCRQQPYVQNPPFFEFTPIQSDFLGMFLVYKMLNIAEGIIRADEYMQQKYGLMNVNAMQTPCEANLNQNSERFNL